jgi:hypothetical protein
MLLFGLQSGWLILIKGVYFMNIRSFFTVAVLGLTLSMGAAHADKHEKKQVAEVSINETQFGFIIGGSVGGGELTYKGKKYSFKIGGVSLGANIGVSKMSAVGGVYDMKDIAQFPGTYLKLDGSVAFGGGVGNMTLKNENGVIMTLKGTTEGLQLNAGASGVQVKFN